MPNISNATVATGTGLSTAGNGGRKLVRLSNGWLVASLKDTSTNVIYLKVDKQDGLGFVSLCHTQAVGNNGWTIVNKGTWIYLVYSAATGAGLVRFDATTVTNNEQTGTAFETGQTAVGNVSLAINDAGTELHAAWSSKNATYPNSFNIRYAKGTINGDGSVTWSAVEQLTKSQDNGYDFRNPSVTFDKNAIPIIVSESKGFFLQDNNGALSGPNVSTVFILKRDNTLPFKSSVYVNNPTWSAKTIYSDPNNTHAQSNPSSLFVPTAINGLANGRLWVAWHGKDATDSAKFNVRVSYSDDGGLTWATPVKLTSGNLYDRQNVSLAADKTGKVFALYEEHQWSPDIDIYMRTFNSGSWGAPVAVAEADPTAESNPSALVDYSLQMTTPPFVFTNATDGIKFSGNFNVGASVSPASGALGNKETATLTAYTVTPEAGSTVTSIVEKVNGVTVNTFNNPASLSRTLTVPTATWDTLAYFATHTASVTVTDSNGAATVTTYSFDKRLATGASLLEATKANTDAKNRMRSQLDAISTRVGVANGSSTNQIISAIDSRNVVKRQNGTAVVSGGQIVVNTLGFLPKTITIRSSATQNGTYSELLGTNESRNGTTITQNAFTNITATGFTALISGTNVTWEAQG